MPSWKSMIPVPLLAVALCAWAGGTDLSTLSLGRPVMGPPQSPESLLGKVVMVEFWGTH